jgi:hypothetical protein
MVNSKIEACRLYSPWRLQHASLVVSLTRFSNLPSYFTFFTLSDLLRSVGGVQNKERQGFGKPTDVGQYKAQLTGYSPHQDCSVQYVRYWTLYLFICVYHTLYGAERLPPVL